MSSTYVIETAPVAHAYQAANYPLRAYRFIDGEGTASHHSSHDMFSRGEERLEGGADLGA
jgi:hypothetical protein